MTGRDIVPRVEKRRRYITVARYMLRSCTSKGIGRLGVGSFCNEIPCFNTTPCRPTPFLAHFGMIERMLTPRGNHLSNTTCLTLVFFKRGE